MGKKRTDWAGLSHEQKVKVLAGQPMDAITGAYSYLDLNDADFRAVLARERRLWKPENVKEFKSIGSAPTKDVVLGAWRDLNRSEAILELIDNSIDAWLQRRQTYPKKVAPELNVYVDIDKATHQLTYEDNAGGVSVDKLQNLVVPGFSDTTPLTNTIGSYRTGGKKAIFRLAREVAVTTRYWSPAETSDDAVAVHLDSAWIDDPTAYKFPYAILKDKSVIERGQTRYLLQLREEPVGGPPWFDDPESVGAIRRGIRTAYSLLWIRNPNIHIHFLDRTKALDPLDDLYSFSGTHFTGTDIRPQMVAFKGMARS